MARYTEDFKASVVAMIRGAGWPDNEYAIMEVHGHLKGKVHRRTLLRWVKNGYGAPPVHVVHYKKKELADLLEDAAYQFVGHATSEDVVEEMSGQQAMTSAAIAIDKMRLLRNLPTEIIGYLPVVSDALRAMQDAGMTEEEITRFFVMAADRALTYAHR